MGSGRHANANLLAVVGGILHAHQVGVGPAIQVGVLTADVPVPGVTRLALAPEHGVGKVAQVVAAGVLVAVVTPVRTGIPWCADLERHTRDHIYYIRQPV